MKRTISLILCLLLLACCAGCTFTSGKDGKDAPAQENAAETENKTPAEGGAEFDTPASSQNDAEAGDPASTEWPGNSEEGELPEIEIPFEDDELIDPNEMPSDSQSPETSGTEDPGFVPEEDLVTDNPDLQVDENGDTLLPEIED